MEAEGQSLINDAQAIIDSAIPSTPLQQETKDLIGAGKDLLVGGPADNIPDGGAGDNRLIDWSRKPVGSHNIKVHPGSKWIKPFVCDFKPDDPNKDIKIKLSEKGAGKAHG